MIKKPVNATRICDICGEAYYGEQYGPYAENICDKCFDSSEDLPLITEDSDDSEIPSSVFDEIDGGKDIDDDD